MYRRAEARMQRAAEMSGVWRDFCKVVEQEPKTSAPTSTDLTQLFRQDSYGDPAPRDI